MVPKSFAFKILKQSQNRCHFWIWGQLTFYNFFQQFELQCSQLEHDSNQNLKTSNQQPWPAVAGEQLPQCEALYRAACPFCAQNQACPPPGTCLMRFATPGICCTMCSHFSTAACLAHLPKHEGKQPGYSFLLASIAFVGCRQPGSAFSRRQSAKYATFFAIEMA